MAIEFPANKLPQKSSQVRSTIWQEHAHRILPDPHAKPTGWLCLENRVLPMMEIDLLEIIPGEGLHIRTRQESWLVSLPEELQSVELLRGIISGEVNSLSGSCILFESPSASSKLSSSTINSVLEFD